jgi:hypothetical protein
VRRTRERWVRAAAAALIALLLLLAALYALDRSGGRIDSSDVWAAVAASLIAGAVAA